MLQVYASAVGYRWNGAPLVEQRRRLNAVWESDHAWLVTVTRCPTCGAAAGQRQLDQAWDLLRRRQAAQE